MMGKSPRVNINYCSHETNLLRPVLVWVWRFLRLWGKKLINSNLFQMSHNRHKTVRVLFVAVLSRDADSEESDSQWKWNR
jgi:hypothetical protein